MFWLKSVLFLSFGQLHVIVSMINKREYITKIKFEACGKFLKMYCVFMVLYNLSFFLFQVKVSI